MPANSFTLDVTTRHAVFVNRYAGGQSRVAIEKIKSLAAEVDELIAGSQSLGKTQRINSKIAAIEKILGQSIESIGATLKTNMKEFAEAEADFESTLLLKISTNPVSKITNAMLSEIAENPMRLLVGKKVAKITVDDAISDFTKKKRGEVKRVIQYGVAQGQTGKEITRNVKRVITNRVGSQVDALVRTVVHHISNTAVETVHKANSDIIQSERWVATLDARTTLTCAGLDGTEYPIGKGPQTPYHWNCRSRRIPIVKKEFRVLGLGGERAAVGGPVSASKTFGGWLKSQPAAFQDEFLGKDKGKLFRSGGLSIGDFTDTKGSVYTLDQLKRRNPLAFEQAKL